MIKQRELGRCVIRWEVTEIITIDLTRSLNTKMESVRKRVRDGQKESERWREKERKSERERQRWREGGGGKKNRKIRGARDRSI